MYFCDKNTVNRIDDTEKIVYTAYVSGKGVFFCNKKNRRLKVKMTKYYDKNKGKVAFTLTELVVIVILLSGVASIVSVEAINKTNKKMAVEKVQSTYNLLEKATIAWQSERNCTEDIKICIKEARIQGESNKTIFNGIAKYLPVISSNVDINAKGRTVKGEKFSEIEWLPENTKTFDGNMQPNSSVGVSKYYDGNNKNLSYYMLRNGVTIVVDLSDYNTNTGFGFFDIDGKEGENRIGVDVFPFSLGSDISSSHALYEVASKKFNPYFSTDNYNSFDLCNIKNNMCSNEKMATNPTVYVLKQNKLPH